MATESNALILTQDASIDATLPLGNLEAVTELETLAEGCQHLQRAALSAMQRTFRVAVASRRLNELITDDMMKDIMALQGHKCGFSVDTDKTTGKPNVYSVDIVKRVMIEATLKGLRMSDNEVNIIAGNMYAAQAGLMRLVREWPGLTDLRFNIYPSESRGKHCVVSCKASYRINGELKQFDFTGNRAISIRVNQGMGEDAIQGKAKRKLFARLYESLLGFSHELVEDEDGEIIDVECESVVENNNLPENYFAKIECAQTVSDVGDIAKAIGADVTLSPDARAEGSRLCAERVKAIRNGRGERSNQNDKPADGKQKNIPF